ncbi:cation diffusion facilitator family transporter [Streptacidiphilus sp. MAP12-16]|uniref:cation diffusion facilitator family transporter n=1 Tax=Streptacidiphilus sp. MAP12-16 TaxID=3156300 RepID=UPI0035193E5E
MEQQPHTHDHGHDHEHDHPHDHPHPRRRFPRLRLPHVLAPHSHDSADKVDRALATSADGLRTLWLSLAVLAATAAVQLAVASVSHSVALLGDAVHNVADALTALPLAVAFLVGRRAPTRRYTYGYGRAEDLAGLAVLAVIAASAGFAAYTAVERLLHPRLATDLPAVAAAALVGFVGNELVARYRIRTGRRIGSAALVADGLHARTDGFTSLAVLLGAGGTALGWGQADPVVGLLITVAVLLVLRDAAREVFRRLMDAVDPALVDAAEGALGAVGGVRAVGSVRLRWVGHGLRAETEIAVAPELTVVAAHAVAVEAEHTLLHAVPRLTAATVHIDTVTVDTVQKGHAEATAPGHPGHPGDARTGDPHAVLAHHASA